MAKDRDIIEKIDEELTENVFGGFYGKDWKPKSDYIYERLGIGHKKKTWGFDIYSVQGRKIPKKFAYAVADAYEKSMDQNENDTEADTPEEIILDVFDQLKLTLDTKDEAEALKLVWKKFG